MAAGEFREYIVPGATLELVRDFCIDHVAEVRCAVVYQKPRSEVDCEYVRRRTDRWINFPWSTEPPVVDRQARVTRRATQGER